MKLSLVVLSLIPAFATFARQAPAQPVPPGATAVPVARGTVVTEMSRACWCVFQARNGDYWFGSDGQGARGRLIGQPTSSLQAIDAEILEVHTAGAAYHPQTMLGAARPGKKRDLRPGQTIDLECNRRLTGIPVGKTDEGKEYWIVIMPGLARKAIPRAIGSMGRSGIVFAMPVGS